MDPVEGVNAAAGVVGSHSPRSPLGRRSYAAVVAGDAMLDGAVGKVTNPFALLYSASTNDGESCTTEIGAAIPHAQGAEPVCICHPPSVRLMPALPQSAPRHGDGDAHQPVELRMPASELARR